MPQQQKKCGTGKLGLQRSEIGFKLAARPRALVMLLAKLQADRNEVVFRPIHFLFGVVAPIYTQAAGDEREAILWDRAPCQLSRSVDSD